MDNASGLQRVVHTADHQVQSISKEILERFYSHVWTLEAALDHLIKDGLEEDVYRIAKCPQSILIASTRAMPHDRFAKVEAGSTFIRQRELIVHVQRILFAQHAALQEPDWKSPQHILAQGYKTRPARDGGQNQIIMEWPNSAVEELKKSPWNALLQLVGEEVMIFLLKDCSLFMHVANDCWIQISGQSVMELKESKNDGTTKSAHFCRSPAQIILVRSRIFYNQEHMVEPTRRATKRKTFDDKEERPTPSRSNSRHILHRLARPQHHDFIHLTKYILPLEFRLQNVFTSPTDYTITTQPLMDYSNREKEFKLTPKRPIPRRARPFFKSAKYILTRHRKCHYRKALDYFCPARVDGGMDPADCDAPVSSSGSSVLVTTTQMIPSPMDFTAETDLSLEKKLKTSIKPRFAEYTTPARLVSFFAQSILRYLLPSGLLGSKHNFELIMSKVDRFIRLRRFESMSLHDLLQGIRCSDVEWASTGSGTRKVQSDCDRQRRLTSEVIFWIFDGLLMPLLRSNFYITESSAFKNQTLYFRRETWLKISHPIIHHLSETLFRKLERRQLDAFLSSRKLGTSFVRLLPKSSGVRPIINLRRRIAKKGSKLGPSINNVLQPAAAVLSSIQRSNPKALGSSCFGLNDIYRKLKQCKSTLSDGQKLYFVKLDIKSCYDRIVQSTLLKLVNELINDDEYLIQKFAKLHKIANKVKRKYILQAYDAQADYPNFVKMIQTETSKSRHVIFADSMAYSHRSRETLLSLIDEHIARNSVKIGDKYYQQSTGIAQGSILSSMLCSLHFGNMENKHLWYLSQGDSQLMRLIDDFLLITKDKNKAAQFLQHMHAGFPAYGCTIATEKTLVNFAASIGGYKVDQWTESDLFPWCGLLIDTKTLSVRSDISRFTMSRMSDTLTVETCRNQGVAFMTKMKHTIKQKLHRIYIDPDLNDPQVVLENVFNTMVVAAMKLVSYTRKGRSAAARVDVDDNFALKGMLSLVDYCISFLKSQSRGMRSSLGGSRSMWRKSEIEILAWQAFNLVVSKKQTRFSALLALVRQKLKILEKAHPLIVEKWRTMKINQTMELIERVSY